MMMEHIERYQWAGVYQEPTLILLRSSLQSSSMCSSCMDTTRWELEILPRRRVATCDDDDDDVGTLSQSGTSIYTCCSSPESEKQYSLYTISTSDTTER
jgi:hypothetical protein